MYGRRNVRNAVLPRLEVYGLEPHIILFTKEDTVDIDLPEDRPIIIKNAIERGIL